MKMELAGPGIGVSALLLSLGVFFTLAEKEILSQAEVRDIVDMALSNLKTVVKADGTPDTETIRSAGRILESVRTQIR